MTICSKCVKDGHINIHCFTNNATWTENLNELAKSLVYLRRYYIGAYSADERPPIKTLDCCWITNVDELKDKRSHWVAFFKTKTLYYFDSFAISPERYNRGYWRSLAKEKKFVTVKKTQLQSKSTKTCGMWCLLFLYAMALRINNVKIPLKIKNVLKSNKRSKTHNELALYEIMKQLYGKKLYRIYSKLCKETPNNKCCNTFNSLFKK